MLEKIRSWYLRNHTEISWFLIGWLSLAGLTSFVRGDYVNAFISLGFAVLNYVFVKRI